MEGISPLGTGNSQNFGYDSLNRLINAKGSYGTEGYTYDAVGNRVTQTFGSASATYTYSATSNKISSRTVGGATVNGARALSVPTGEFTVDSFADCFTVDLNDLSIAGHSADDLLPITVFSLNRSAIRDVIVNGKLIVRDQQHSLQKEIVTRYNEIHRAVWQHKTAEGAHR